MMDKTELFNAVRNLVAAGETDEVFALLRNWITDLETLKTIALIESAYNDLMQAELKGTLSPQDLQTQKNQVNDRLLNLFKGGANGVSLLKEKKSLKKYLPLILVFVLAAVAWFVLGNKNYDCPAYSGAVNNRILILPFVNSGNELASPHIVLRDRINQLVQKNNISANAQIGGEFDDMTLDKAPALAKDCPSELLVWGTYSANSDSIRLILQYYFSNQPDWSNTGELVASKDVTSLFNGQMLKNLDDAVFSLCGVLAFREGDNALAKKWFEKVGEKEEMDRQMLQILE